MTERVFLGLLALVLLGRGIESVISRRNQQKLAEHGARQAPESHFFWMVLWNGGVLACAALEVVLLQRTFIPLLAAPMLAIFVGANLLRWWVIRSLAEHWNWQVMNSTALGVVTRGPYRWVRHPNYVALFAELVALPLIHAAWLTALAAALATTLILTRRVSVEEAVLMESADYRAAMGTKARFIPGLL